MNLDIYFSDACNSNCEYFIQNTENNQNTFIEQALDDNTFATNVKHNLTREITSISIWGKEPSINGKYFHKFIVNILDYDPYIQKILIPTDGQSDQFYNNFIIPLLGYCITHQRELILIIRFTLDGPPSIHNKYHGEGHAENCLNNIKKICRLFPFSNNYLRLCLETKSIFRGYEIEHYSPQEWLNYARELEHSLEVYFPNYEDCRIGQRFITFAVPYEYTVAQGQALSRWNKQIHLDLPANALCQTIGNSKTIDYLGNLYDCHLLANKNNELRAQFEIAMDKLVLANEVIEQDRDKLFNAISCIYCIKAQNNILDGYIRLLGNGFLL